MLFNIQTVLERPQKSYSGLDSAQTMLRSSSPQLVDNRTTTLSLPGLNLTFPAITTTPSTSVAHTLIISLLLSNGVCLQCFDAVGWATGKASGQ